ncbi:MAG: 2-phospho-L-lactate transferase CofD family protein, partial [Candidatus Omnitrophota bacterium]|nr:2-phospho-L-lactate transferase CofD family protein [Candidatus Omnitrophota bacterium]
MEFRSAFQERFNRYYQYNFWLESPAFEVGVEQGKTYRELVEEKASQLFRDEYLGNSFDTAFSGEARDAGLVNRKPRFLVIGGGTATRAITTAYIKYHIGDERYLPLVVLVDSTDSGGSTGRIQQALYKHWNISIPAFGDIMAVMTGTLPAWKQDILEYRYRNESSVIEGLNILEGIISEKYRDSVSSEEIKVFVAVLRRPLDIVDHQFINPRILTIPGQSHSIKNLFFLGMMIDSDALRKGIVNEDNFARGLEAIRRIFGSQVIAMPVSFASQFEATLVAKLKQRDTIVMDSTELEAYEVVGQVEITSALHEQPYVKLEMRDRNGQPTRPAASFEAIRIIESMQQGDRIVVGPGSDITSKLVTISMGGIPDALRRARQRGVEVMFVFNSTIDTESVGHTVSSLIKLYEDTLNYPFERIFSSVIVNRIGTISLDLEELMDQDHDKAASLTQKELLGKLMLGLLQPTDEEIVMLRQRGIRVYANEYGLIVGARTRQAGEIAPIVKKYYYDTAKLAFLFVVENLVNKGIRPVLVADKDETLTPAMGDCSSSMARKIIDFLRLGGVLIVLSTADRKRLYEQTVVPILEQLSSEERYLLANLFLLPYSGGEMLGYNLTQQEYVTLYSSGTLREILGSEKVDRIMEILDEVMDVFGILRQPNKIQVEELEQKITFRAPGKLITTEEREGFDIDRSKRTAWVAYIRQKLEAEGIYAEVGVSGVTSIDILPRGVDKGYGIEKIGEILGVPAENIIFVGDSFGPQGGDTPAVNKADFILNVGPAFEENEGAKTIITSEVSGPEGLEGYFDILLEVLAQNSVVEHVHIDPSIFRGNDIRGEADAQLTDEVVSHLAGSFGVFMQRKLAKARPIIAVGRDIRFSSERIHGQVIQGLLARGVEVIDVGIVPTGELYFSIPLSGADGGVMVTASHNPKKYNGIKFVAGLANTTAEEVQEIKRIAELNRFLPQKPGRLQVRKVIDTYKRLIKANVLVAVSQQRDWQEMVDSLGLAGAIDEGLRLYGDNKPLAGLRIVVDCANGVAQDLPLDVLRDLGAQVIGIHTEADSNFPNHKNNSPDPSVAENLSALIQAVKENNEDMGIAYDGDADRMAIVDNNGDILPADILLVILARDTLRRHPGSAIIFDVKCSQIVEEKIIAGAGRAVMAKTGFSEIKKVMREIGREARLGGENSGHFYLGEHFNFDDGLLVSARMAAVVAGLKGQGVSLHDVFSGIPKYPSTPEMRLSVGGQQPEEDKFKITQEVEEFFAAGGYEINTLDGARIIFKGQGGWALIRASQTEPKLILRAEARTKEGLRSIINVFFGKLREYSQIDFGEWLSLIAPDDSFDTAFAQEARRGRIDFTQVTKKFIITDLRRISFDDIVRKAEGMEGDKIKFLFTSEFATLIWDPSYRTLNVLISAPHAHLSKDQYGAHIYIRLFEDNHVKEVSLTPHFISPSRSRLAIYLEKSGLSEHYPSLYALIKDQFVLPVVNEELIEQEAIALSHIPLAKLSHDINSGEGVITSDTLNTLLSLKFSKSQEIRRIVLRLLEQLSHKGVISEEELLAISDDFILEDIKEDLKFIERIFKYRYFFVKDTFKNIFDIDMAITDLAGAEVEVKYLDRGANKQIYKVRVIVSEGRSFVFIIATIRDAEMGAGDFRQEEIDSATESWIKIYNADNSCVPVLGSIRWEEDWQPKSVVSDMVIRSVSNNIQFVSREFIEGEDLEQILASQSYGPSDKKVAIVSAIKSFFCTWYATRVGEKGIFLGDPKPDNIVLRKTNGQWQGKIIDLDALHQGWSLKDALNRISLYQIYTNELVCRALIEFVRAVKQKGLKGPPEELAGIFSDALSSQD